MLLREGVKFAGKLNQGYRSHSDQVDIATTQVYMCIRLANSPDFSGSLTILGYLSRAPDFLTKSHDFGIESATSIFGASLSEPHIDELTGAFLGIYTVIPETNACLK